MAIYRPARCAYCDAETWCELRARGAYQCRACKVERFFELVLYPPLGYKLQDWQRMVLRDLYGTVNEATGRRQYRKAFISLAKQQGKELALDTKIPQPDGWSTMGDIRVGDLMLSEYGLPVRVTAKSEVDDTERAFELTFGDGTKIIAGERHEWRAVRGSSGERVFQTLEMFGGGDLKIPHLDGYHAIASINEVARRPMQCIEVDNPTHMYLAGESMVPTHNSFLLGGLPIYHMLMEDELQPEAFGVASARDQAGIIFNAAKLMVDNNRFLKQHVKVLESTKRIVRCDGRGLYAVLAADGGTQDGKRPSLLLIDELHRFKRKSAEEVHSVLTKGTISRKEPLTIEITTSGDEFESPLWFSEYNFAKHILDGSLVSDTFYTKIWQADPERVANEPEYWKSREARVAANPSHEDNGGFLPDERLVDQMNEAIVKPEKYAEFIRLHLNVPIAESETPAISMPKWYEGGGGIDLRAWGEYDIELLMRKWDLIEKPCVVGVDLAWTTDFSSMAVVFPPSGDFDASNLEQWKVIVFFWMPADRVADIERRTRAPLTDWIRRGFLTTVPGAEMDLAVVESKIKWAVEMFDVRELAFDKWGGMRSLAMKLNADEGMTTVDVRQGFATISGPTKDFLAMHQSVRLAHGNNPILNWNASCLALLSDGNDNVRPNKPDRAASSKRIDGVVATITALARATLLYQPPSVYASRGPLVISED